MHDTEENQLAFTTSIQPARRAWMQAATTVLSESGLSMSLGSAVILLHRGENDAQQKTLAAQVGINPAAMVRVLDQGEQAGLLVRQEVPGDRRTKTVALLPAGTALALRLEKSLAALRDQMLADVTQAEIATAIKVLRAFEARAQSHVAGKDA